MIIEIEEIVVIIVNRQWDSTIREDKGIRIGVWIEIEIELISEIHEYRE